MYELNSVARRSDAAIASEITAARIYLAGVREARLSSSRLDWGFNRSLPSTLRSETPAPTELGGLGEWVRRYRTVD